MRFQIILSLLVGVFVAWTNGEAQAQNSSSTTNQSAARSAAMARAASPSREEQALLEMAQAFRRGDVKRLSALAPLTRGHLLEPWATYWDTRARLEGASASDIRAALQKMSGTYQEDRLRNDWLLLLGQARDWENFDAEHPLYRMNDDRDVRCYRIAADVQRGRVPTEQLAALADEARRLWLAQREADDACTLAVDTFVRARLLGPADVWQRARQAAEGERNRMVSDAVNLVAPDALARLGDVLGNPARYLSSRATAIGTTRELVVLALARLAQTDPDQAATQLDQHWGVHLSTEQRSWAWGAIGRSASRKLSPLALGYFANGRDSDMSDEQLAWKVRAALRAGSRWKDILSAINAMSPAAQQDPAWVYWRARALLQGKREPEVAEANAMLQGLSGGRGFYEKLAQEELGGLPTLPPRPAALTPEEIQKAQQNPGLQRALAAIALGLRADGVREWNYSVGLHTPGGMPERDLLAAAQMACEAAVWDRCINTSERTRSLVDAAQRFPMPHRDAVMQRSREIGLDPAYVYGLIRQESRFIVDARSGVGASGLMQVMPATARWTARKIGLDNFQPSQINERDINIAIGTGYLKLVLDDFDGSMALASAAYNAGPSRPRAWRAPGGVGPELEGAAWAETIPFAETRDYVKKVLSNTVDYAALISGQPQSLKARLGRVGPRNPRAADVNRDLP